MKSKLLAAFFVAAFLTFAAPQDSGTPAPALSFTRLMQVPAGTRVDWPSLKGKVIVLEFWATWCAPCIAEIPILNSLAASVDPSKVQIISVDDEEPAIVEKFLNRTPISGWIGIDTSGELFKRYGVNARPTTLVVDTQGVIVSTNVPPQQLKSEQLLALAAGKPVKLGGAVDPEVQAALTAATAKAMEAQAAPHGSSSIKPLFEITLTPADPPTDGAMPMTHIMRNSKSGKVDITNGNVETLLANAANVGRTTEIDKLPDTRYNLHVEAPNVDPALLSKAVESGIALGTGLHIEHETKVKDAYVLTALPTAKDHFKEAKDSGFAYVDMQQKLNCMFASPNHIAGALENYLGTPVVDETGLSGKVTAAPKLTSKDLAAVNASLGKEFGLMLTPGQRPIETVVISSPTK